MGPRACVVHVEQKEGLVDAMQELEHLHYRSLSMEDIEKAGLANRFQKVNQPSHYFFVNNGKVVAAARCQTNTQGDALRTITFRKRRIKPQEHRSGRRGVQAAGGSRI
jgi:hypothetical protein